MAEAALFSLAAKLLGELASASFKKAYQRVQSVRKAKEDLDKLSCTIQIIQAVLLDAEKKHGEAESEAAIGKWIQRVRDVLYDADDLFDDVATDALLMQQQPHKDTMLSKVRASFSNKFSAVISDDNIAKKVKSIRKRLDEISKDMAQFQFMITPYENQKNSLRSRAETWPFVDEKIVIGRDDEKQSILEFLFEKSDGEQSTSVIAIVGIGGMGKTTLAQLIYNHEEVQSKFENKWWACISDIVGETNVLEKIARSIDKDFRLNSDPKELVSRSVRIGSSYLLVLDDVWDNDLGIWLDIMSLLRSGSKGSKIIVTTRFESVPWALQKDKCQIYRLKGLSENKSWELFKRIAFTEEQENDPRWTSLGREIMHKCVNVPLAIKSIASLLLEKNTLQEWKSFKDRELSKIVRSDDSIMSTLKLSYDHLPSHLKHCFAYCSLFPQDSEFDKEYLISQWIAQGYVSPNDNETFEEAGHSYFMGLIRKSFFQEAVKDDYGEIESCKMHDLLHDLAKEVAGRENLTVTTEWNQFSENTRHVYVCYTADISKNIPDANRLRSWFFKCRDPLALEPLLTKLKLLRALDLRNQGIENVPSSIGVLKHLRYLDLSSNKFTSLPDSLTKLVNLLTLNVSWCSKLEALPNEFRNLKNLRNLYNADCWSMHIPPDLVELTCLQRLSFLKVGRKTDCSNRLAVLSVGCRLKGRMEIEFDKKIDDWDEDDCWQLPTTLQSLEIRNYPGRRIPHWERGNGKIRADNISCNLLHNLVRIEVNESSTIKHLPPFRHLPYLRCLHLEYLDELEYIEEEEEGDGKIDPSTGPLFPRLEKLILWHLKKLKGWSRKLERAIAAVEEVVDCYSSFYLLSTLRIFKCPEARSMPLCPKLESLNVQGINEELMKQLIMSTSSSSLEDLWITECDELESFSGGTLPSLKRLNLSGCHNLKNLYSMPLHLEELLIWECGGLELWEEDVHKRSVDWESLPELRILDTGRMGELPKRLPHSLQQLQDCGQLQITDLDEKL